MRLGDLVVRFVADMGNWNTGIQQAQGDMDKTTKSSADLGTQSRATSADFILLSGTAVAAGYAVYSAAQRFGGAAQELKNLSYQTGVSTGTLQKLQYAAMLSGTDFGKVAFALNTVTLSMEAATERTSAQAQAFKKLGVDPSGKSPAQVFEEITYALSNTKDETTRNAVANDLLGKSWKEILPFMSEYIADKEKINAFKGYSKDELKDQESLKVAFDESVDSLDKFFGHWVAGLGKVAKAQAEMESTPSYLDQWLSKTFGEKPGKTNGAGGRSGPDDMVIPKPLNPEMDPALQSAREKIWKDRQLYEKDAVYWIDQQKESEQDLLNVAKKLNDVKKEERELRSDYFSDMQNAGQDVSSARQLTVGFNRSMKKLKNQESETGGELQNAAFKNIAANRKDADAYSSFSMSIENVNLSKDYPLNAFISDYERVQATKRKQQGVRTAT